MRMKIETKDDHVPCPKQNWQKIPITTCRGWNVQAPRCQYFVRCEDTHIICNHPPKASNSVSSRDCPKMKPPGRTEVSREICHACKDQVCKLTHRPIHKRTDGLRIDCPRFTMSDISLEYCTQTCSMNRGFSFSSVACAYKENS